MANCSNLSNDFFDCNPAYLAFKPVDLPNQVVGLFFCTDGSGDTGVFTGCNKGKQEAPPTSFVEACPIAQSPIRTAHDRALLADVCP